MTFNAERVGPDPRTRTEAAGRRARHDDRHQGPSCEPLRPAHRGPSPHERMDRPGGSRDRGRDGPLRVSKERQRPPSGLGILRDNGGRRLNNSLGVRSDRLRADRPPPSCISPPADRPSPCRNLMGSMFLLGFSRWSRGSFGPASDARGARRQIAPDRYLLDDTVDFGRTWRPFRGKEPETEVRSLPD